MRYRPDHKQRTRQRILDGARRQFAANGYAAVSIDEIMRDCGLTRGGFYAHFQSKAALYREALGSDPDAAQQSYAPLPFWAPTPD
jgi:TetR/AcrR family transcriptional repressor of nem operon